MTIRRHVHRDERSVALGIVSGKRHGAREQVGTIFSPDPSAFAYAEHVLNLLITGLDGERNDDLVNDLAHQDLLELRKSRDRLLWNVVDRNIAGRIVNEANHFVSIQPVILEISVRAPSQMTSADN